jgi:hypothetical protein
LTTVEARPVAFLADRSCAWGAWDAELAGDGLTIKAPPNPLRGVTVEDAEYMKCVIEQVEGLVPGWHTIRWQRSTGADDPWRTP